MGATFSTQYVIQAINTVDDPKSAKIASFSTALFLVPFGIITALVGMCSLALFPKIKSIDAFAALVQQMDGVTAELAKEAFALASAKLPFRTIVVQRMLGG